MKPWRRARCATARREPDRNSSARIRKGLISFPCSSGDCKRVQYQKKLTAKPVRWAQSRRESEPSMLMNGLGTCAQATTGDQELSRSASVSDPLACAAPHNAAKLSLHHWVVSRIFCRPGGSLVRTTARSAPAAQPHITPRAAWLLRMSRQSCHGPVCPGRVR